MEEIRGSNPLGTTIAIIGFDKPYFYSTTLHRLERFVFCICWVVFDSLMVAD
jgi:hypothetical protein